MRTEAETLQQHQIFLAWALHCWALQRICMHPAAPKSLELVSLRSAIPAWLGAAPPIYFPLLSHSWMPQEWLHVACAALSSVVQRGPHLALCCSCPSGIPLSGQDLNLWWFYPVASTLNSTRDKLGMKCDLFWNVSQLLLLAWRDKAEGSGKLDWEF